MNTFDMETCSRLREHAYPEQWKKDAAILYWLRIVKTKKTVKKSHEDSSSAELNTCDGIMNTFALLRNPCFRHALIKEQNRFGQLARRSEGRYQVIGQGGRTNAPAGRTSVGSGRMAIEDNYGC